MASAQLLSGQTRVRGYAVGEALVSQQPLCFSPEYFDIATGTYLERRHELYGLSLAGRVLVFPCGRGFSGGAYCIYALARHATAPAACIGIKLESVSLIGFVLARIPTVDSCEQDPLVAIASGQTIVVNADKGEIQIKS